MLEPGPLHGLILARVANGGCEACCELAPRASGALYSLHNCRGSLYARALHETGRVLMAASVVKELYASPNGDRWSLCRLPSGKLVVSHKPNKASGGPPYETDIEVFLAQGGSGPEHQALREALAALDRSEEAGEKGELSAETLDKLCRAMGQAVARCWSSLPQEVQHNLFEAAVTSQGEPIRQQLALYLHGKHRRTIDAAQARAMPEPDSL